MKSHSLIDERSLAFDRLIAMKLREQPVLIEKAKANLQRWLLTCSRNVRPDLLEWQRLLDGPFETLLDVLESTTEESTRLRQSSPFCGILSQAERTAIILEYQSRESNPA